jgi:hypothetical protein
MPYQTNETPCKCCGVSGKLTRIKWHKPNSKFYIQSTCKDCEYQQNLVWRKINKEKWAALLQRYYIKKNGPIIRNMNHTEETRKEWKRHKSNSRCSRAKLARRYDEFTIFTYKEAHELRKMRNKLTGIEWHVDHIIPLKHSLVCGLHVWNNFAVIPKVENLRKGNYYSIYD